MIENLNLVAGENITLEQDGSDLVVSSSASGTTVHDTYSASTTDSYSCNYVNDLTDGTKPMGNIVVDNVKCKNMLNTYAFIKGNISSTGEYQANNVNYLSDYIELEPNTQYIASANVAQSYFQISEWTSNKTFIQRTALQDTTTNTITTTATTKYVRISYNKDNSTTMTQEILLGFEPQFELGTARTSYTPHKDFDNTIIEYTSSISGMMKTGFEAYSDGSNLYKTGSLTTLTLNCGGSVSANTATTIATLPSDVRPKKNTIGTCIFHSGGNSITAGMLVVYTNGDVKVTCSSTMPQFMFTITYVSN